MGNEEERAVINGSRDEGLKSGEINVALTKMEKEILWLLYNKEESIKICESNKECFP